MKYNKTILHPAWVTGFIDGEGCFYCGIKPNSNMILSFQVTLVFSISQHIRDILLMKKLIDFFNCGYINKVGSTQCQYRISNINDLEQYLFPLLNHYTLKTKKFLDAEAFIKIHKLILTKKHLTIEGLNQIKSIKATMNRARMQ